MQRHCYQPTEHRERVSRQLQTNKQQPITCLHRINCTILGLLLSLQTPGTAYNFTLSLDIRGPLGETRSASHAPVLIASPLIRSVEPSFGPVAGGTRVRVSGVGLGVGTSLSAEIIGASQCSIVSPPSYADGDLECITETTSTEGSGTVILLLYLSSKLPCYIHIFTPFFRSVCYYD